jgi:hypothetical protein
LTVNLNNEDEDLEECREKFEQKLQKEGEELSNAKTQGKLVSSSSR